MYEPIRTKSVHSTMAGNTTTDFPHRSREEELDIQLAGHLAALLAVTDELRASAPSEDLDVAAERLAAGVSRLRGGRAPARTSASGGQGQTKVAALHRRAHALAGRALVVFQPVVPGKQFSSTTACEDVQVRARGVACARSEGPEAPASETARTL